MASSELTASSQNHEEFECNTCYELADDALESQCCHKLFCQHCLDQLRETTMAASIRCPVCRVLNFEVRPNIFVKRLIAKLIVQCPHCDEQMARSKQAEHVNLKHREFKCPAPNCEFTSKNRDLFAAHLTELHLNELTDNAGNLFVKPEDPFKDPVSDARNRLGFRARLGITGKFYCARFNVLDCSCCNGRCGPDGGCNCVDCMALDLKRRRLPKGYLVNSEGAVSRKSKYPIINSFYCGRLVMMMDPETDGYCGPDDGNNCFACKKLDVQSQTRYRSLLE